MTALQNEYELYKIAPPFCCQIGDKQRKYYSMKKAPCWSVFLCLFCFLYARFGRENNQSFRIGRITLEIRVNFLYRYKMFFKVKFKNPNFFIVRSKL